MPANSPRPGRRWSFWPIVLAAGALAGCFAGKDPDARCDDRAEYQGSDSIPGLTSPEGLSAPNQASGYTVPPAVASAQARGAGCLARPPDFFRKDPAAAAPANP